MSDPEESSGLAKYPSLPARMAFVVQFASSSDPQAGSVAGRVEHVASGTHERFASYEELCMFFTRTLAKDGLTGDGRPHWPDQGG